MEGRKGGEVGRGYVGSRSRIDRFDAPNLRRVTFHNLNSSMCTFVIIKEEIVRWWPKRKLKGNGKIKMAKGVDYFTFRSVVLGYRTAVVSFIRLTH